MLAVISPAKRLGTCPLPKSIETTAPRLANESRKLVEIMRTFDAAGLSELMHISSSLAEENVQRFASWKRTCAGDAEPAVCLFQGDVYRGLAVDGWKATEHRRAASHLRILSGLYGLLRPHDMILPHRLEMGTKLDHDRGRGLPAWWGGQITSALTEDLQKAKSKAIVNLASAEYAKAVQWDDLPVPSVTCAFQETKGGKHRTLAAFAKPARGMFARWMLQAKPKSTEDLKAFNVDGYSYVPSASDESTLVFRRPQPAAA